MLINGISHHSYIHLKKKATKGFTLFSKKDKDSLYDACRQVIGASIYRNAYREYDLYVNNRANPTYYWRIYPVIVFDGPIWEIERIDGETLTNQADWVTYDFQWNGRSRYIDIVSWNSFDKYLDMLEGEIKRFQNAKYVPKVEDPEDTKRKS